MLEEKDAIRGLEYKYVLVNDDSSKPYVWETGENRVLPPLKEGGKNGC